MGTVLGGHGLIGVAVTSAMENPGSPMPADKLIAQFGQKYREWPTHGV